MGYTNPVGTGGVLNVCLGCSGVCSVGGQWVGAWNRVCKSGVLPCICLWQISQIQTCMCVVVGPGFVSTSPAFMRDSASHPAGPHGRLAPKR